MEKFGRKRVAWPILVGILLTIILLSFITYLASINRCTLLDTGVLECRRNLQWFLDAAPNEIGDTIAGIFATLAFVWIVVTVFLQSSELAEQREELRLTRLEFEKMSIAQGKQVEALTSQTELLKDERMLRNEESARSLLEELLRSLAPRLNQLSAGSILYRRQTSPSSSEPIRERFYSGIPYSEPEDMESLDMYTTRCISYVDGIFSQIGSRYSETDYSLEFHGFSLGVIDELKAEVSKICELSPELSNAQRERLRRLRITRLNEILTDISRRMTEADNT